MSALELDLIDFQSPIVVDLLAEYPMLNAGLQYILQNRDVIISDALKSPKFAIMILL
jgi:hypothetical protein